MRVLLYLVCILAFTTSLYSQPQLLFTQLYDNGGDEMFWDIYLTSNNEYIAAGSTADTVMDNIENFYVVKVDTEGDIIWENTYNRDGGVNGARTIIETDDGDFMVAGESNGEYSALRVNADGEELWFNVYGAGNCTAIIELKAGEFMLAGISNNQGYLICINGEGDVLWENDYGTQEDRNSLYAMRETAGGVVVSGHLYNPGRNTYDIWVIKVNLEGDLIWDRTLQSDNLQKCYAMVSAPDEGFVLAGYERIRNDWLAILLKINDEGNLLWSRTYNLDFRYHYIRGLEKTREGDYLIAGYVGDQGLRLPFMLKTNSRGVMRWSRVYDLREELGLAPDQNGFWSVIIGADNSMIAAGKVDNSPNNFGRDALIVKLGGEIQEPSFIAWSPEDTVITTVLGDTIDFWVFVEDQQDDELSFLWLFNEQDTLSRDSAATYVFDELGEQNVKCRVSDDEFTVELDWRITVQRFAVVGFTPDTLVLSIRRGTEVDFSVETRAIDGVEIEYNWALTNRNGQQEELGNVDNVSVLFELPGEYELQCFASNGEEIESIVWTIDVRSSIYSWWPLELDLAAYKDSTLEFVITPFNEDSDSLEYVWLFNGEPVGSDSASVFVTFPDVGQSELTSIVHDGVEADTIRWTVNVSEWSFTTDLADLTDLPTSPTLYPASPNPFNSSVKLSMYLPKADHVSLAVFDVSGREVARLVDGDVGAGGLTFVWNASDFPAGVYVVRMEAGDAMEMRKVVLVR